jgi:putative ABC transport system ATP-binding protein
MPPATASRAKASGSGAAGAFAVQAINAVKIAGRGATTVRALDGVTVGFPIGRLTAIMGPSGSGKSTLLQCLAGLDSLTSGRILFGGTDLGRLDERQRTALRRERVGFVFQAFNLVPTLTALENIVLPMALGRRRPDRVWLRGVIDAANLWDRLQHRPSELSGGQQQWVAVARALVGRPHVVFADEPTGNLDSQKAEELLLFMRRAAAELGQTIVMVTHDPVAASHADRVVFLSDGRIVGELLEPTPERIIDWMKLGPRA